MSTHGRAEAPPTADRTSDAVARKRHSSGLARCAYCIEAGIGTTIVGAWASSGLPGSLRAIVWVGLAAPLVTVAVLVSDPAIDVLDRCLQLTLRHRGPRLR